MIPSPEAFTIYFNIFYGEVLDPGLLPASIFHVRQKLFYLCLP